MEARHALQGAGGEEHRCIECPNGRPEWLAALADLSVLQMGDWPTQGKPDAQTLAVSRAGIGGNAVAQLRAPCPASRCPIRGMELLAMSCQLKFTTLSRSPNTDFAKGTKCAW